VDSLISHLKEYLATRPSRRSFLSATGKMLLGGVAALTGLGTVTRAHADALGCCCCTGCASASCPANTHLGSYTWLCCPSGDCFKGRCYDCLDNTTGATICTYMANTTVGSCVCIPG
jgi:hypothetical protein